MPGEREKEHIIHRRRRRPVPLWQIYTPLLPAHTHIMKGALPGHIQILGNERRMRRRLRRLMACTNRRQFFLFKAIRVYGNLYGGAQQLPEIISVDEDENCGGRRRKMRSCSCVGISICHWGKTRSKLFYKSESIFSTELT